MKNLTWERVDADESSVGRAKVPGGWLVREHFEVFTYMGEDRGNQQGYEWRGAMTFVPDPLHLWGRTKKLNPLLITAALFGFCAVVGFTFGITYGLLLWALP